MIAAGLARIPRFIFLAVGAAAFAVGVWTGLSRLGAALPGGVPDLVDVHGALMICGFLGTVISLERAVALARWWAYAAPLLSGLGALALLAGATPLAAGAFLLAAFALILVSSILAVRLPALFTVLLAVAAALWAGGTTAWLAGRDAPQVAGWWLGFLVLTIAAERLELSRLLSPPPWRQALFAAAAAIYLAGIVRGDLAGPSSALSGVGLITMVAWLAMHDIARQTVRGSGQPRLSAACILAGYFWLAFAGLLLLTVPPGTTAFSYDAIVHAIAIGFVLSMIFGHVPIILPAVTGLRVRAGPAAYGPLMLLHLSVLVRVAADIHEWIDLRPLAGMLTVAALVGYAGVLIVASRRSHARSGVMV